MSEFLSLKTRVIYSSLCEEMSATVERDATRLGLHEGGCALHPPSLDASAINVCVPVPPADHFTVCDDCRSSGYIMVQKNLQKQYCSIFYFYLTKIVQS
jgi:hypothetical protein